MPMIAIKCPSDISEKLSKISVPGKKEKVNDLHITMFYFEKQKLSIDEIVAITKATYSALKSISPIRIKSNIVSSFPRGSHGIPVIMPIVSDELLELRKKIAKKFEKSHSQIDLSIGLVFKKLCS